MDNIRGFSLLETTVAIAILIMGVLGPMAVTTYALSRASISENEIVAYNLAEEALEFVINTRDTNVFRGDNWLTGLTEGSNNCDDNDGCYIDVGGTAADQVRPCPSDCTNTFLRRNTTTGLYNHASASGDNIQTVFKRRVLLLDNNDADVDLDNDDERVVRVIITWNEKFLTNKSFTIEHHIFERD